MNENSRSRNNIGEMESNRLKATKISKNAPNRITKYKSRSSTKSSKRGTRVAMKRTSRKKNLADDGYVRPKVTASDLLTAEQIKERIKNYERMLKDNIFDLKVEDKIAYFEVLENGKFKYKPGGYLLVNGSPDYLVLTSGKGSWSVQLENHIIFRARDIDEIEQRHQIEMDKATKNQKHLRQLLIKQKNVIHKLRQRIDELEE